MTCIYKSCECNDKLLNKYQVYICEYHDAILNLIKYNDIDVTINTFPLNDKSTDNFFSLEEQYIIFNDKNVTP